MELKNYSIEEQKSLVRHWNYYYGKGIRTLQDNIDFDKLLEKKLDEFLRLMVLEKLTPFYTFFKGWNPKNSLFNLIHLMNKTDGSTPDKINPLLEQFFNLINEYFSKLKFKVSSEEVVEAILREFENPTEKISSSQLI